MQELSDSLTQYYTKPTFILPYAKAVYREQTVLELLFVKHELSKLANISHLFVCCLTSVSHRSLHPLLMFIYILNLVYNAPSCKN